MTSPALSTQDQLRAFAPMSARRLLTLTGIAMILAGMIFGDLFAVFILHQNAARVGSSLTAAANAALAGDTATVSSSFQQIGQFLENRGTKVDTHVHLIGFGYLALMLAILQPWMATGITETFRRRLAWAFLFGGIVLPSGVFLIHYVGLAYSPLQAIGWASIFADAGGAVAMLATAGYLFGLARYFGSSNRVPIHDPLLKDRNVATRMLLAGGLSLVLIGFLQGSYYAGADLYRHETAEYNILAQMSSGAAAQDAAVVNQALAQYGELQGDKAVKIAAHAHFVEFGLLAMLLGFFQPYVNLSARWQRSWACVLLFGSTLLPVCVLLELKFGLLAGGLADLGGLLVVLAGLAMWIGILRYTGKLDATLATSAGVSP